MNRYSRIYAEIDLDAVVSNMEAMHRVIKEDTKIMAVVKADGYGHGALPIARAIDGLPYLYGYAVATFEESMALRQGGFIKPILILGYVFPDQYEELIRADIRPTVFTFEMAQELSDAAGKLGRDCNIHFAVDTGMSRIGYQVDEEAADEMARIAKLPHIVVEGIFTHFATADEPDKEKTYAQLARYQKMTAMLEARGVSIPLRHSSNSAGIIDIPEANLDLVRAGIILYGLWPSADVCRERLALRPAMSLITHVSCVKELPAGREISYGGTWRTDAPCRIATIPVGYADGYARSLSNKGTVLIHGKRAPIRGRICMDQFMVDVTGIPDVKCGDSVVLVGRDGDEQITMEELGNISGRFNYEFVCGIGKRVPRIFRRNGKITDTGDFFSE